MIELVTPTPPPRSILIIMVTTPGSTPTTLPFKTLRALSFMSLSCRKGPATDAFLARGCSILGGVRITDPDAFLDVLAEGGSGYHFFGKSAQKIVLRGERRAVAGASCRGAL